MNRLAAQLAHIEVRITELAAKLPSQAAAPKDDKETFTHLLQLQDRLMVELQSFGRKLEGSNVSSDCALCRHALPERADCSLSLNLIVGPHGIPLHPHLTHGRVAHAPQISRHNARRSLCSREEGHLRPRLGGRSCGVRGLVGSAVEESEEWEGRWRAGIVGWEENDLDGGAAKAELKAAMVRQEAEKELLVELGKVMKW